MLESVIIGILCSFVASVVFWVLTYKITRTDVIFSDYIENSTSVKSEERTRYRIRLANYGKVDLIEVTVKAKIFIHLSKDNTTYLEVGNDGFIPILPGRQGKTVRSFTLTIYPGETAMDEFSKKFYKENIKNKAAQKLLTLEDIFDTYKEQASIQIYVFGNDSLTGARRMVSKEYSISDIKKGLFSNHHNKTVKNKAQAVEMISEINPKKITKA